MAKKGQAVQLQTEVNTDEEWEKLLQREGLILVDVYSEWCGPCSGMTANLKKLKLEIGGDLLQLAIAKCDKITALERFRNKCEPTWMFIVNGKMVNFMFGANAPKLTRLIIDELKKEQEAIDGRRERVQLDIEELTDEERDRKDIVDRQNRLVREEEEQKATQELLDRRTLEARRILDSLHHLGVVMIFPHARPKYLEVLRDLLDEAGLTISQTDKQFQLTDVIMEELLFFDDIPNDLLVINKDILMKPSLALLIKRSSENLPSKIEDVISQMVYGNPRTPPGVENCPYQKLLAEEAPGIWTPPNANSKALALKWLFPTVSNPFKMEDIPLVPPHVAAGYDAFKCRDVVELMVQFPAAALTFGFFTSDIPAEAQLIAKTVETFETRTEPTTYEEKMVVKLSKSNEKAYDAFCELGPSYMSSNAVVGEEECKIFFPEGYEVRQPVKQEVKKKSKKKKAKVVVDDTAEVVQNEQETPETAVEDNVEDGGNNEEKEGEEEEEDEDEGVEEMDKATSPMADEEIEPINE